MSFLNLPNELILDIAQDLETKSIASLRCNRRLAVTLEDVFLRRLLESDSYALPLLSIAIIDKNQQILRLLIEEGPPIEIYDGKVIGRDAERPRVETGATIQVLLSHESHAHTAKDVSTGGTAIHWAVKQNSVSLIKLLVSKGADLNAFDNEGLQPIHLAASPQAVCALVLSGANINGRTRHSGSTALHYAVGNSREKVLEALITQGADIDLPDNFRWTPLHLAVSRRECLIVGILLRFGADFLAEEGRGRTPIDLAEEWPRLDILTTLGGHIARYLTSDNQTVAHIAVQMNGLQLLRFSIEHGVDINATDNNGQTALHYAVHRGHIELVKALVGYGADTSISFAGGTLADELTERFGVEEAMALLTMGVGADL